MKKMNTIGSAWWSATFAVLAAAVIASTGAAQFDQGFEQELEAWFERVRAAQEVPVPPEEDYVPHQLLVVFEPFTPDLIREFLVQTVDGEIVQRFEHVGVDFVRLAPQRDVRQTAAELERSPFVRGADPNYRRYPQQQAPHLPTPNDPLYPRQWALDNTGSNMMIGNNAGDDSHVVELWQDPVTRLPFWQNITNGNVQGIIDASIDARQAWVFDTDCSSIVIAVIDRGMDIAHPDMVDNLWVNPNPDPDYNDIHGVSVAGGMEMWHDVNNDSVFDANDWIIRARFHEHSDWAFQSKSQPVRFIVPGYRRLTDTMAGLAAGTEIRAGEADANVTTMGVAPSQIRMLRQFPANVVYFDVNQNGRYDPGEPVIRDIDQTLTYVPANDEVIIGAAPPPGTALTPFAGAANFLQRTDDIADYSWGGTRWGHHGTAVSSVIAARGDNNKGITGVCWKGRIMTVKASQDSLGLVAGIDYVVEQSMAGVPVRVINYSSGGKGPPIQAELDALVNAAAEGILFVTSAGNDNINVDSGDPDDRTWPCMYHRFFPQQVDNMLCVAASDNWDRRASFSNFGVRSVHVFAPGERVLTAMPWHTDPNIGFEQPPFIPAINNADGRYAYSNGTSFASPYVAGIAAHFWTRQGFQNHTYGQVMQRLLTGLHGPLNELHPHGVDPRWGLRNNVYNWVPPGSQPGTPLQPKPSGVISGLMNDGRARMVSGEDFGDAPIQVAGQPGIGAYHTLKADNGARHRDIRHEWLGACVSPEFNAENGAGWPADPDGVQNIPLNDGCKDGFVVLTNPIYLGGTDAQGNPNTIRVQVTVSVASVDADANGGRYGGAHQQSGVHSLRDNRHIWVNGFFDWYYEQNWDYPNAHAFMLRVDPSQWGGATTGQYILEFETPGWPDPDPDADFGLIRVRLDYGENAGVRTNFPVARQPEAGSSPGGLYATWQDGIGGALIGARRYDSILGIHRYNRVRGIALFGEVEDYDMPFIQKPPDEDDG